MSIRIVYGFSFAPHAGQTACPRVLETRNICTDCDWQHSRSEGEASLFKSCQLFADDVQFGIRIVAAWLLGSQISIPRYRRRCRIKRQPIWRLLCHSETNNLKVILMELQELCCRHVTGLLDIGSTLYAVRIQWSATQFKRLGKIARRL